MGGRKPQQRTYTVKPIDVPLHPLRCYTAHPSLRGLVLADLGKQAISYDVTALTKAAREAINETLSPHKLRLGDDDMFYIDEKPDHDSDLTIGLALQALDVVTMAQSRFGWHR